MSIERKRQTQSAGDGSNQFQVAGDLVIGITEDRAREIARSEALKVRSEFTLEAHKIAEERISALEEEFIPALADSGGLQAFADPSFLLLVRKAQEMAASTSEARDHQLLARLLSERAKKDSRRIRLAIGRAVEIVDQLDDNALAALTTCWIVRALRAVNPQELASALRPLEDILQPLYEGGLDHLGRSWIGDLEILDCIRTVRGLGGSPKPQIESLVRAHPGLFSEGFSAEECDEVRERLDEVEISHDFIVDHEFIADRHRLRIGSTDDLLQWVEATGRGGQIENFKRLAEFARVDAVDAGAKTRAWELIQEDHPCYFRAAEVWNNSPAGFFVTAVGQAMAYTNAKRWHSLSGLPELDAYLGT